MDINPYLERMRKAEAEVARPILWRIEGDVLLENYRRHIWIAAYAAEFVRQTHTERVPNVGYCIEVADNAVNSLRKYHDESKRSE